MSEFTKEQLDAAVAEAKAAAAKETEEKVKKQYEPQLSELEKLRSKDFNFKRLREMTEDEKEKLTEIEKGMLAKQDKLEEALGNVDKTQKQAWKEAAISRIAAGNDEYAKEIEDAFGQFAGEPKTEQEIRERAANAAAFVAGKTTKEQFRSALGVTGSAPMNKPKNETFADTEAGKGLAAMLNLEIAKETKK